MIQTFILLLTLITQNGATMYSVSGLSLERCTTLRAAWLADVSTTVRTINASAICMPVGTPGTDVKPLP